MHRYFNKASGKFWWFLESAMVDQKNWVVHEGLRRGNGEDEKCTAYGGLYSSNQGVILGAAAELHTFSAFKNFTEAASKIADSAIAKDSTFFAGTDVFGDQCNRDKNCKGDEQAYKAIFIKNLRKLAEVTPGKKKAWTQFIKKQADSILEHDIQQTGDQCEVGLYWQGPIEEKGPIAQWSALEVFLAAYILENTQ